MENMAMLQELSGDATISNCTFLHYSVLEEIPIDGIERRVGKEAKSCLLVPSMENTQPLLSEVRYR